MIYNWSALKCSFGTELEHRWNFCRLSKKSVETFSISIIRISLLLGRLPERSYRTVPSNEMGYQINQKSRRWYRRREQGFFGHWYEGRWKNNTQSKDKSNRSANARRARFSRLTAWKQSPVNWQQWVKSNCLNLADNYDPSWSATWSKASFRQPTIPNMSST